MSMTDPVADLLTRIRNGQKARHSEVKMPASKLKGEIARLLKEEGYVADCNMNGEKAKATLTVKLKPSVDGQDVITNIKRVSKPGLRIYVGKDEIPSVLNGLGVAILSTSKGVMTDKSAKELGIGGELLCTVY